MKQNIILAVFALLVSTTAVAQSNVVVYGTLEQTMEFTTKNTAGLKNTNMSSGDSKIGFKVTEELGNGLKAFATVEFDVKAEGGSTMGNDGQAFVGLGSTTYGSIQAGQFDSLTAYNANRTIDKFEGRSFTAVKDVKLNNAAAYISPNFYGFTAAVATVTNGQNGTAADRKYIDANEYSVNYTNGGFFAGLAYNKARTANGTPETTNTFLGAAYKFSAYEVNGGYERDDTGLTAKNVWTVGGAWDVTSNNSLRAAYRDTQNTSNAYTLEGVHNFSKRTAVYANWQAVNGRNANADVNTMGLGLRHNF